MNLTNFITRLSRNADTIHSLVNGITGEQSQWKPKSTDWSILEVVNHLYDEEREDFRMRLDLVLNYPGQPWPSNDPEGWVKERQYNNRDLADSLQKFLQERKQSVIWLEGLLKPDWNAKYIHPEWGAMSAGTLMTSWVVHDFLHIRQLARLHRAYIALLVKGSYSIDYAGTW